MGIRNIYNKEEKKVHYAHIFQPMNKIIEFEVAIASTLRILAAVKRAACIFRSLFFMQKKT